MLVDLMLFGVAIMANILCGIAFNYFKQHESIIGIILKWMGAIGEVIHRFGIHLMCLFTGVRIAEVDASDEGYVSMRTAERITFIQGFLLCFGPLLISSYILYIGGMVAFYAPLIAEIKILIWIVLISICLASDISHADFRILRDSYTHNPSQAGYRCLLLIISTVIIVLINLPIPYFLNFLYFILVGICYTFLKYIFMGFGHIIKRVRDKRRNKTVNQTEPVILFNRHISNYILK